MLKCCNSSILQQLNLMVRAIARDILRIVCIELTVDM